MIDVVVTFLLDIVAAAACAAIALGIGWFVLWAVGAFDASVYVAAEQRRFELTLVALLIILALLMGHGVRSLIPFL